MELHYSHPMWHRISARGRLFSEEEVARERRTEEERARLVRPVPPTIVATPRLAPARPVLPARTIRIPPTVVAIASPSRAASGHNDEQLEELEDGEIVEEIEEEAVEGEREVEQPIEHNNEGERKMAEEGEKES